MRQGIAVAIVLLSYEKAIIYKKERNRADLWKGLLYLLLASTFHKSSLLVFLVYPLLFVDRVFFDEKKKVFILALLFGISISYLFPLLLDTLLLIFPKYNYYIGTDVFDGEYRLALTLQLIVYLLLYLSPYYFFKVRSYNAKILFERIALVNIFVIVLAMNATALARFGVYFSLISVLLYSNNIAEIDGKVKRFFITTLTLILFYIYGAIIVLYKTPEWQTTYPFTFGF